MFSGPTPVRALLLCLLHRRLILKTCLRWLLAIALIVVFSLTALPLLYRYGSRWLPGWASPTPTTVATAGLTLQRVTALAELTTLRVTAADARVSELRGHTGAVRVILLVRGEVCIAVDLAAARFESADEQSRRAVLILPPPHLQSARLDHERTRLLAVQSTGLWLITPGGGDADTRAINHALREAQRAIGELAEDPELRDRARRQAQQVLCAFCKALGWEIEIRWTDPGA